MTMTLEQFRASGRDVEDLGAEHPGLDLDGVAGRIYVREGGPYVERHSGSYHLILGNCEWAETPANLPKLERLLWQWAKAEGAL